MNNRNRTISEFISAYKSGERHFKNWEFEEDESVKDMDLSDIFFEDCFLFLDFRNSKLINSKFVRCNIKTADFRGADLTNAMIKNCSVESVMFKGAKTDNMIFEENYYFGATIYQADFDNLFKNSDEFYS